MAKMRGFSFILAMGKDLHIFPGDNETDEHYVERVILSAGTKWMLTAVHAMEKKVSVESIKKTAGEKIDSYLSICDYHPDSDTQNIVNYLYETLLENGMFYHEPGYVRPVLNRGIGIGDVSFIRGLLPEENAWFSGMAPYIPGGGNAELADEFMLWKRNGEETIKSTWLHSSQQDENTVIDEYLRVNHEDKQRYYDKQYHDQEEMTMGRTRKNDLSGYEHYLIHGNEIRRFTDDYVNASIHEYVRLAIVNDRKKQKVMAKIDKELVELYMGYLLPEPDERFMRFVSWPDQLQELQKRKFQFNIHPRIWPVVKERLIFLGYAVEEQHE